MALSHNSHYTPVFAEKHEMNVIRYQKHAMKTAGLGQSDRLGVATTGFALKNKTYKNRKYVNSNIEKYTHSVFI